MEPVVTEEVVEAVDGVARLQRRWRPDTARAAMLLVHGVAEHSGRYDEVGRRLAAAGFDVVSFDNRGHGRTGGLRGHVDRFELFLDDVEELLAERRGLGLPVILAGHSLGGLICTTYLVRGRPAPDLLVLSSPALGAVVPRWQRLAAPILSRLAPRLLIPSGVDATLLSRDVEVQRSYEDDPLRLRRMSARLGYEVFRAMASTSVALDRLALPTYVLHGVEDELVPSEVSRPLDALPNVTYRLWPGLRHECLNEPEGPGVLGEVVTWLDARLDALSDRADGPGPRP